MNIYSKYVRLIHNEYDEPLPRAKELWEKAKTRYESVVGTSSEEWGKDEYRECLKKFVNAYESKLEQDLNPILSGEVSLKEYLANRVTTTSLRKRETTTSAVMPDTGAMKPVKKKAQDDFDSLFSDERPDEQDDFDDFFEEPSAPQEPDEVDILSSTFEDIIGGEFNAGGSRDNDEFEMDIPKQGRSSASIAADMAKGLL